MKKFCHLLPKIEVHAHLNGSLSDETIRKLLELKSNDAEKTMLAAAISQISSDCLKGCFEKFSFMHRVTDSPKAIFQATLDVIDDFYKDNVYYLELRSTPREIPGIMTCEEYIEAMLAAIDQAKSNTPAIIVKLLISIDRSQTVEAAMKNVNLALKYKNSGNDAIVGIDLSGNPINGDVKLFYEILAHAKMNGLKLSLHMGETVGNAQESPLLLNLPPDRIGHGTYLSPSSLVPLEYLLKDRIPLELCPSSNVISGTVESYSKHHFKYWYDNQHPLIICTDDKGIFNTSLSNEYFLISKHFALSPKNMWEIAQNSVDHVFCDEETKLRLKKNWNDAKFNEIMDLIREK